MKIMRTAAGTLLLILTSAQTPEGPNRFEVASVKPGSPPDSGGRMRIGCTGGPGTKDPGLYACSNVDLMSLVTSAFDLQAYQFSGPEWMRAARFTITVRVPEEATNAQFKLMQQNLLTERFKLTFHREKKEMQAYDLVVAKGGVKMKESSGVPQEARSSPGQPGPAPKDTNGFPILPAGRVGMRVLADGRATLNQVEESMEQLAKFLSARTQRPVIDATGLTAKYDLTLRFAMEGNGPSAEGEVGPTIFQAVQEQLGLKLESKKIIADIFVVDRIERTPTEN